MASRFGEMHNASKIDLIRYFTETFYIFNIHLKRVRTQYGIFYRFGVFYRKCRNVQAHRKILTNRMMFGRMRPFLWDGQEEVQLKRREYATLYDSGAVGITIDRSHIHGTQ